MPKEKNNDEEMKVLREALFGLSQVPTPLDDADDPNPAGDDRLGSKKITGSTPEIVEMKRAGLPLTMESYLDFIYPDGVPEGAELEIDFPKEINMPEDGV